LSARALLILAIAALQGCTGTGAYKPEYLGDPPDFYGEPLAGRALLYVSPQDRTYVYIGRPKTLVGSAVTVTLPLGLYVPEVGKEALAKFFSGGVELVDDLSVARRDPAVHVHIGDFAYRYELLTTSAVFIDMRLDVTLLDPDSRALWSDTYRADEYRVQVKCPVTQPEECVNKAAHVTLLHLMYKAGSGLRNYRYAQGQ
jgi:hypothetical protein